MGMQRWPRCPKRHRLKLMSTLKGSRYYVEGITNHTCNACEKSLSVSDFGDPQKGVSGYGSLEAAPTNYDIVVRGCQRCNYHLCLKCYAKGSVPQKSQGFGGSELSDMSEDLKKKFEKNLNPDEDHLAGVEVV